MDPVTHPKRSTGIHAPVAEAFQKAPVDIRRDLAGGRVAVFDPDRASMGPNELLAEMGKNPDPRAMLHGCGGCGRIDMRWEVFSAHRDACWNAYQRLHPHNFAGATRKDSV